MFPQRKSFRVERISWNKAHSLAKIVAKKIKYSGWKPDIIIGILRGGPIPAKIISDYLLQKNVAAIRVIHYWLRIGKPTKAKVIYPLDIDLKGKKVLLVDDVADTSSTLEAGISYLKKFNPKEIKVAVLHHKIVSKIKPDFYAAKVVKWRWISYAWAMHEDLVDLIGRFYKKGMKTPQIRAELKKRFMLDTKPEDIDDAVVDLR